MTTIDRPSLPPRRFNLGDVAIVIGALAVFFALARYSYEHPILREDTGWTFYTPYSSVTTVARGDFSTTTLEIVGTGWIVASITLVPIRLRHPRPRWQRLMRQPGWIATVAASIAVGVAFVQDQIDQMVAVTRSLGSAGTLEVSSLSRITTFPDGTAVMGCLGVLIAWIILRWGGHWRRERSWIDRSGRVIGWGWLLMPLVQVGERLMGPGA